MKKRILIALVVVLALAATASLVWAGGPAEKATGSIEIERADGKYAYAEFNAHEAKDGRPAKGEFHWWAVNPDETLHREVYVDVSDVEVDGQHASFSGVCTYDSWGLLEGDQFCVQVHDGGTPGINGDSVEWKWTADCSLSLNAKTILDGNLVVHTY